MVGPARRREAVTQVRSECREVSERRACQVLKQPRSTQRYACKRRDGEAALASRMGEYARAHPRYGYRRIWALLRMDGWIVNRKRVHRLWQRAGLALPTPRVRLKWRTGQRVDPRPRVVWQSGGGGRDHRTIPAHVQHDAPAQQRGLPNASRGPGGL